MPALQKDPEAEWKKTLDRLKNPKAREFFTKGKEFVQKTGGVAVKVGTDEFEAWQRYFDRIGWTPFVMELAERGQTQEQSVTMPTQWPEWFDSGAAG